MTTPEGKIKAQINKVLSDPRVYAFMPVQNGMGAAGLDYHCAVASPWGNTPFWIEAKAPGKRPQGRQLGLIEQLREMGFRVFVIDGDDSLEGLRDWLAEILAP